MVEISKPLFQVACKDLDCHVLLHPWHGSCIGSIPTTYWNSLVGSAKFYSLIYVAQILMRGKKLKKKEEWFKMGEFYVRSTILGAAICASCSTIGCIFRLFGNRFYYYSLFLIPSTINGVCIYLEPPSRRSLVINLFSSLMLEYWMRTLEKAGYLSITKSKQTLMFMLSSAFLFYFMRLEGDKKERTPLFWLFTPEKVKQKTNEGEKPCPHNGSCLRHILKGTATYFGVGSALTLARVVLPKISSPVAAFASIQRKHFKMGLFFGSYIGIYRAVICYLCHKRGADSALYALPAGYLAGLSFLFSPSLGFATASVTAALKLYSTILYEKKVLPTNIPLPELLYCICQGTLFHARFMHPETCPSYMFKLTNGVSNGRCYLEYWMRTLEKAGYLSITKSKLTIMFMLSSVFLFYFMRLEGDKKERTPILWLFTPEKVKRKTNVVEDPCPHNGSCLRHILKGTSTYFGVGSALTLARVVLPKISSPVAAFASIQRKHFKMGLFFGSYIGFATASVTAALKLYSTILYEKKVLPTNIPLPELLYCICQGTLFHARFMHPETCPSYIFELTNGVSNGRAALMSNNLQAVAKIALSL